MNISAIAVFTEGILSFLSPCVLPMIPLYVGYLSGGAQEANRKKTMVNTVLFVIGISSAFFLLGLGVTGISRFLVAHREMVNLIGGAFIVLIGLIQLLFYGKTSATSKEYRLPVSPGKLTGSPLAAFLLGFVFSFAWTPCVGPMLSSVLIMAASQETAAKGFMLIGLYTLGFVIPFLAVGFFTSAVMKAIKNHPGVVKYTVRIGAVIMIAMGILMMTGGLGRISAFFAGL